MKKLILALTISLLSNAAIAQDKPAKGEISTEEKAKLKEIHKERKAGKEARKGMSKEQRKAEHMATKAKVDNILNNEQDAKMSEIRKKRIEYRKN
jgi:hypothetical protein